MTNLPPLVLASASPRRRALLELLGLPFTVLPSPFLEPPPPIVPVSLPDLVVGLARDKAAAVAQSLTGECRVIGADTLVTEALEGFGLPLGKPADAADARRMLKRLAGRDHAVYTGIAVIPVGKDGAAGQPLALAVRTRVRFRALSEQMISDYVATGEPMDKAGAYGAQGYAAPFIEEIEGDFYNVVGLPLCSLGRLLERSGLEWQHFRSILPPQIG